MFSKIFKRKEITLSNGKVVVAPFSWMPIIFTGFIIAVLVSLVIVEADFVQLVTGFDRFISYLTGMFPPDWSYLGEVIPLLIETIQMSILGSFVGAIIALPISVLASRNINKNKPVLAITRVILSLFRTMPVLIYALILTYIFDLGAFAGVVAISLFSFSIVSKMMFENIETIDMGPFEAAESMGHNKLRAFWSSIMPQVVPTFISVSLYTFEINIRSAVILGYVGAGGIGLALSNSLALRQYDKAGMILIVILVVVVAIEITSRTLKERLT